MGCQNQWTDVTDTEISDIIQKADLNTEQKPSAGAMDSEFQIHLQYVVQKGNKHILQITGLIGKTLIIICVANIPSDLWSRKFL